MIGCFVTRKDLKGMDPALQKLSKDVVAPDLGPKLVPILKVLKILMKIKAIKGLLTSLLNTATKTLVKNGTVDKLLAGQVVKKALRGPFFKHREQVVLYCVLKTVVPPCLSCKLTRLLTLAFNGLLGKIPLLKPVTQLVNKLVTMLPKLLKILGPVTKLLNKVLTGLLGPKVFGRKGRRGRKGNRGLNKICKKIYKEAKKGLKGAVKDILGPGGLVGGLLG